MNKYHIRKANTSDLSTIYELIHSLARYEKREQDATLSLQQLNYWLFEKDAAAVLLLEDDTKTVGYALCYPVFASFAAEAHVHLEDMYIRPDCRRQGLGRWFMENITSLFLKVGYTGMEWSALSWNEQASSFYLSLGAERENNRIYFRLDIVHMKSLAEKKKQVNRIQEMEETMERLSAALASDQMNTPQAEKDYQKLDAYYENEWRQDYEADERKELPAFLKRGVLSEDGLYDLLSEYDEQHVSKKYCAK